MARTICQLSAFCLLWLGLFSTAYAQDLSVTALTSNTTRPQYGQEVTLNVAIRNISPRAVLASIAGVFMSVDAGIAANQDHLLATISVPALAANGTHTTSIKVIIPPHYGTGNRWIGLLADYENKVAETNEGNNSRNLALNVQTGTGPDLRPSALTLSKTTARNGEQITVNYTITNGGTKEAPASSVSIRLSTNTTITTVDTLLKDVPTPKIAAGQSHSGTTTIIVPAGWSGNNYVGIFVDIYPNNDGPPRNPGKISELSETNNTRSTPIIIQSSDLRIISILVSPANFNANASVTFSVELENAGLLDTPASELGLYFSLDRTLQATDSSVQKVQIPALKANSRTTVKTTFTITTAMLTGFARSFYVIAQADDKKAIQEVSETNNTGSFLVNQSGTDLLISSFSISPTPSVYGRNQEVTVTFTVLNNGNRVTTATTATLHYSTDTNFTSADTRLTSIPAALNVPTLAGGTSTTITAKVRIPNNATPGTTRYLFAFVDNPSQNQETNETNNTKGAPFSVGATNLHPTAFTVTPTTALRGAQVTVSFKIKNDGNQEAPASIAGIYFSTNNTISTGDTLFGSVNVPKIAAGQEHSGTAKITIPANANMISGFLGVYADRTNVIPESNESYIDNGLGTPFTIAAQVDLQPTSLIPQTTTPRQGQRFSVDTNVKNNGTQSSRGVYCAIYFSTDAIWDAKDLYLGRSYINGLAAGQSTTTAARTFVTLSSNTPAGPGHLIVRVDYLNYQGETNENNNTLATKITVQGSPDLSPSQVTPSLLRPTRGSTMNVQVTVKNLSNLGSTTTAVTIYLSSDPNLSSNDTFAGTTTLPAIAGGQQTTVTINNVLIPTTSPLGRYYLIAFADSQRVITESNESNNTQATAIDVVAAPSSDLIVRNLDATPPSGQAGDTLTVKFSIHNAGTSDALATKANVYFTNNKTLAPTATPLQTLNIPALKAGTNSPQTTSIKIPAGTPKGTYYIHVVADSTKIVNEGDETNNNSQFEISVSTLPGPIDNDKDGVPAGQDCNDNDNTVYPAYNGKPAANEICDGKDNDCNQQIDEGSNLCPANQSCHPTLKTCVANPNEPTPDAGPADAGPADRITPDTSMMCPGGCPSGSTCIQGQCVQLPNPDDGTPEEPNDGCESCSELQKDNAPSDNNNTENPDTSTPDPNNNNDTSTPDPNNNDNHTPDPNNNDNHTPDSNNNDPNKTDNTHTEILNRDIIPSDKTTPPDNGSIPNAGCGCNTSNNNPLPPLFFLLFFFAFLRTKLPRQD